METAKEYCDYFSKDLLNLTDEEFVSRFNESVGIKAFGISRSGYLWAIEEELKRRKFDYSNIGDDQSISYKHIVFNKEKKLYRLADLPVDEVKKICTQFIATSQSEKTLIDPTIIEYNNDRITFEYENNSKNFSIDSNDLLKNFKGTDEL